MYILENHELDHSEIGNFINRYILPYQYEIFTMITKTIIDEFMLDISNQYSEGTKIEANANKYKFVWKPTTYHKKLDTKIRDLLLKIRVEITDKSLIKSSKLNQIIKKYFLKEEINIDAIPTGKGKLFTLLDSTEIKSSYWKKSVNLKKKKFLFPSKNRKRLLKVNHLTFDSPFYDTLCRL